MSVSARSYIAPPAAHDRAAVARTFLPLFRIFLDNFLPTEGDPHRLAGAVHGMYRFFLHYDFDRAFRSPAVWNSFVEEVQYGFPRAAARCGYFWRRLHACRYGY